MDSSGTPLRGEVTQLLKKIGEEGSSPDAASQLLTLVYRELRRMANGHLRGPNQTIQVTELVNEAYLKLVDQQEVDWQNRAHFYGIASTLMRRIVIDHARKRAAFKRGGNERIVSLDEALVCTDERSEALVLLDQALAKLATFDPRQSKIVELRFFGGMSTREIATVLKIGERTVDRDWKLAQAWLKREITSET
jgi:RNA polymerase sigma factor (TIGR02999 family)